MVAHITMASVSTPLSHWHGDNNGYIERNIVPGVNDSSPDAPQIKRIITFIYFPIGAHYLGNSIQSL